MNMSDDSADKRLEDQMLGGCDLALARADCPVAAVTVCESEVVGPVATV